MFNKIFRRRSGRARFRGGNALLDTALVMPLLLALSLGTAEFGYFFFVKHTLQGAAREGCRAAIVQNATDADVRRMVVTALKAAGLNSSSTTLDSKYTLVTKVDNVTGTIQGVTAGKTIEVQLTVVWRDIGVNMLPVAMGGIGPTKVLRGATVMRKEG